MKAIYINHGPLISDGHVAKTFLERMLLRNGIISPINDGAVCHFYILGSDLEDHTSEEVVEIINLSENYIAKVAER